MIIDKTQKTAFIITTALTIALILLAGAEGFSRQFRQPSPEMWIYALAQSIGTSFICLITYVIYIVTDLFYKRTRIAGWFLCAFASVLTVFVLMYVLPPPKPLF